MSASKKPTSSSPKSASTASTPKRPAKRRPTSARDVQGSEEARRKAAAILEVLCGVLTPTEGAASLSLSLNRYYVLETRALAAIVEALEPRARGRKRSHARELAAITTERDRLAGEVARLSALLRATERVVGLPGQEEVAGTRRRSEPRGKRVVRALRRGAEKTL